MGKRRGVVVWGGGENERVRVREWGSGEEEGEGKAERFSRGS